MTAPNMGAITASLERSLQNFSLNSHGVSGGGGASGGSGFGRSSSSDDVSGSHLNNADPTLELNSHISLPYHWEQCLDLKVFSSPSNIYRFYAIFSKLNKKKKEGDVAFPLTRFNKCNSHDQIFAVSVLLRVR